MRLSVARGEQSLEAMRLASILTVPKQKCSVVTIEDRLGQFGQPLRPEAKAAPPHRYDFWIGINGLSRRSDHPSRHPGGRTFSATACCIVESDPRPSFRGAPSQTTPKQAPANDSNVGLRHQ